MFKRISFLRNADVGELLEVLLVSAISTILFIRLYLELTGYPQIGGGGLHIAHMLWGGFLMLIALVVVLSFVGNNALKFGAIVGGIGFGTFIDELGKFITSDNDYFFKPTIALLYLVFVLLFFAFRFIRQHQPLSEKEYLLNALKLIEEALSKGVDSNEKKNLRLYLEHVSTHKEITKHLKALAESVPAAALEKPDKLYIFYNRIKEFNDALIKSPLIKKLVLAYFVIQTVWVVAVLVFILFMRFTNTPYRIDPIPEEYVYLVWPAFIFAGISLILVILGAVTLRYSKLKSYFYFKHSLLIYLLFSQFFLFYRDQFNALFGLFFNIYLLLVINHLIKEEQKSIILPQ